MIARTELLGAGALRVALVVTSVAAAGALATLGVGLAVGMHPDDVGRIFEKFGRGRDQSGRQVAGLGLSLYLSRRIVQAHGAELSVDSTPGVGSVFAFDLEVAG